MTTRRIYAGEKCFISEDLKNKFTLHYKHSFLEVPFKNPKEIVEDFQPIEPISRTISAFLNAEGGNIYVGIDNNATIRGIRLSSSMKEHFLLSMNYCLSMFTPPVPPDLVKVHFVELMEYPSESSAVPLAAHNAQFPNPRGDVNGNIDEIDSMSTNDNNIESSMAVLAPPTAQFPNPIGDGIANINEFDRMSTGDNNNESPTVPLAPSTAQFPNPAGDGEENINEFDSMSADNNSVNHLIGETTCSCKDTETNPDSKLYLVVIEVLKSPQRKIYHNDEGIAFCRCQGWNNIIAFNKVAAQVRYD